MSRRNELEKLTICRTVNGYMVDTNMPHNGCGVLTETMYVFETFQSLTNWLGKNFKAEGGDPDGL